MVSHVSVMWATTASGLSYNLPAKIFSPEKVTYCTAIGDFLFTHLSIADITFLQDSDGSTEHTSIQLLPMFVSLIACIIVKGYDYLFMGQGENILYSS